MTEIPMDAQTSGFVEKLYADYKPMLLRTAYRYLEAEDLCEDMVHDAFLRIICNAGKLCDFAPNQLSSYLYTTVRNLCLDYLRMHNRITPFDMADETFLELLAKKRAQNNSQISELQRAELRMMLSQLPAEDRALLVGHYSQKLTSAELAQTFGCTDAGMRTKIHRAKKRMLDIWEQSGLRMEDFY